MILWINLHGYNILIARLIAVIVNNGQQETYYIVNSLILFHS